MPLIYVQIKKAQNLVLLITGIDVSVLNGENKMQVVINISKEVYELLQHKTDLNVAECIIANGIPLPEVLFEMEKKDNEKNNVDTGR